MARVPNTIRRAGVYHFRRALPADLQRLLGRVELCCTLRTVDSSLARIRSRRLYLRAEKLFAVARSNPMLTQAMIARLVRDFYDSELAEENSIRLEGRVVLDEANRSAIVQYYEELGSRARHALATNDLATVEAITHALLQKHGLSSQLGELDLGRLQQAVLRASCELAEAFKARFEGDFAYRPKDKLLEISPNGAGNGNGTDQAAMGVGQAGPCLEFPSFAERAEAFRQSQIQRNIWERQTALQARKTYALFAEHCGDRPLSGYVRSDAVSFKDMLVALPASYGKSPSFRGMTGAQIAAETAARSLPRLTPRTVQRHLTALSALWQSAIENGEASTNIFSGFKLPKAKKVQEQRDMWRPDKLAQLFDTPIWRGCQSEVRRSKPGDLIIRDEKFWLPLIAVFSGMRQEEICQLHVDDVRQESGVWVFDINSRPPRQLKNRNAVRLVPVHKELQRLGLLEHVDDQRKAGRQLVFHQLKPGGADLRLGHNFTKWFTRYRKDVGLYESGVDFHSFRHSATTFMQWAEVPVPIIDALTGHATSGETARYTKNFPINQLREGIYAIDPEIDLSHLYF